MKVFFAATSVGSVLMSGLFIYLMGMVNGMQIQALTCLFRIRLPTNAMSIMIMILNLAAFDMFNTEIIYNKIFNFQETESYTPIFEQASFTGSNFIIGIGPMFGTMIIYALFLIVRKLVVRCLKGRNQFCDKNIVPWFENHNIELTCLTFILEGNLDISFWAFISALNVKKYGIGSRGSNVFSNLCAFVILFPLAYAPIHLLVRSIQHIKQIK